MLRFYSEYPYLNTESEIWWPDLANASGLFYQRVLQHKKFLKKMTGPELALPSNLPPQFRGDHFDESIRPRSIELAQKEDIGFGLPHFIEVLGETNHITRSNEFWQRLLESYYYLYDCKNGTLENLLSFALKIQGELFELDLFDTELNEALSWDFARLMLLARDSGSLENSHFLWKINPTLQVLRQTKWKKKEGQYLIWVDQFLQLREEKIENEHFADLESLREGIVFAKDAQLTEQMQSLREKQILI